MPGAQRKHLTNVSYHLDEKGNMLTGKRLMFKNNNTTFHDGLLFSQAEKSKFILTLRDSAQEPASERAELTSGVGGGGEPLHAVLSLSPQPLPPCHPELGNSLGPIPFRPAASLPPIHPQLWFPKPRHPAPDSQAVTGSAPVCSTPGASSPG